MILGTTEENLKQLRNGKTPQLQAPRPKELQKILLEHQRSVTKDVSDKQKEEREATPADKDDVVEENERLVLDYTSNKNLTTCHPDVF